MNRVTYSFKRAARWLRDSTLGWLWAGRLAVRVTTGRWYVFHDAPWWVVRACVSPEQTEFEDWDCDLVRWARYESSLRLRRGRLEP